jgi:hypothetical protein
MYAGHHNVIQSVPVSKRLHRVTLLVLSRPENNAEWVAYYNGVADKFAYDHDAKVVGKIDVSPNPFRESAVIFFDLKAWKHPEKHKYNYNFTGSTKGKKKTR